MLPKGSLGYAMIRKLKVYAGSEHQHTVTTQSIGNLRTPFYER